MGTILRFAGSAVLLRGPRRLTGRVQSRK